MQSHVENGQIAVVRVGDEVVLRRVKLLRNQLILYPANPNYEPMVIASGDVQIIGRVVEVRIRGL
jgi:SOS-response transcriptional repressor LexA